MIASARWVVLAEQVGAMPLEIECDHDDARAWATELAYEGWAVTVRRKQGTP